MDSRDDNAGRSTLQACRILAIVQFVTWVGALVACTTVSSPAWSTDRWMHCSIIGLIAWVLILGVELLLGSSMLRARGIGKPAARMWRAVLTEDHWADRERRALVVWLRYVRPTVDAVVLAGLSIGAVATP